MRVSVRVNLSTHLWQLKLFANEIGHHLLVEHHMGGTSLGGKIPGEKHRKATAISIVSWYANNVESIESIWYYPSKSLPNKCQSRYIISRYHLLGQLTSWGPGVSLESRILARASATSTVMKGSIYSSQQAVASWGRNQVVERVIPSYAVHIGTSDWACVIMFLPIWKTANCFTVGKNLKTRIKLLFTQFIFKQEWPTKTVHQVAEIWNISIQFNTYYLLLLISVISLGLKWGRSWASFRPIFSIRKHLNRRPCRLC